MENQDKFRSYGDVNREIQALLAAKEATPARDYTIATDNKDIVTLLETLTRTYSEINMALQTDNLQALKDVILKSDIKMSMVCETLLETLKATTEEKNRLLKERQVQEKERRDLESINTSLKIQIERQKNEIEFKKGNVEELNRVIRDQKDRMNELREESYRARNEVVLYKGKIEEIENLRGRANERMAVYEKELEALNVVIKDKEARIQMLVQEKRKEEEKNASIKTRHAEVEALVDALNKKLEIKEKNILLCNSELSKVLSENKRLRAEYENYKESSVYYEGLYKNLNAQNGYLNSQLSKMLKMEEYSKDIDGCVKKFKRRLKRRKKAVTRLEKENRELKEKLGEKTADETSDSLLKQVEELNSKNEKYRKQIAELENEKATLEGRMKGVRISQDEPSFKDRVREVLERGERRRQGSVGEAASMRRMDRDYVSMRGERYPTAGAVKPYGGYTGVRSDFSARTPVQAAGSGAKPYGGYLADPVTPVQHGHAGEYDLIDTNRYKKDETYMKLFNLDNEYEEKKAGDGFIGGFIEDGGAKQPKLALDYAGTSSVPVAAMAPEGKRVADDVSVESVKTYQTSSTLKEMMARTENLQKKFEDLEEKLAQINEGESVEKLTDKIKTYNSYYSEWNADSNESDYI